MGCLRRGCLFPLPFTFREHSVPFAGDDSSARARVCSSSDPLPFIAHHGIEGSIQRRPVHFQFDDRHQISRPKFRMRVLPITQGDERVQLRGAVRRGETRQQRNGGE